MSSFAIYPVNLCLSKFMSGYSRSTIRCIQFLLQVYSGLQVFLQEELFLDFEKAKNMPEDGI